jgi:homoserine dehydrogenase
VAENVGVGLVGLGTVGSVVAARLISSWELLTERAGATPVLRRVAVRDPARKRDVDLRAVPLDDDPLAVVDDPRVSIVVEVMGGIDTAGTVVERALQAGKTVVTANKALIATAGPRLWALAESHRAGLWFEAAAGAGLPVVAVLRDSLRGDVVRSLDAVINTTTNVILTRMRNTGERLDEALVDAQQRGYAEADPSSDVDGWDAAYKLVILTWLATGAHAGVDAVDRRGIRGIDRIDMAYTGQLGYSVKLLAHAERREETGALHLRVRPTALPAGHPCFDADDSDNAVLIKSDLAGTVVLRGVGGGGASTASAVISDIVAAVRAHDHQPAAPSPQALAFISDEEVEVAGYLRLIIEDGADARALVLQALEDRGVPVVETVDKPPLDGPFPQLLVLTGSAPRAVHDRALDTLDTLSVVRDIAAALDRVEPE